MEEIKKISLTILYAFLGVLLFWLSVFFICYLFHILMPFGQWIAKTQINLINTGKF
jgi:hypothetical protein